MNFKLIMAMVNPDVTDNVIEAARNAGATGELTLSGRGSGIKETKSFFGLSLKDQTEIVLFLVEKGVVDDILKAVKSAARFEEPGMGLAFVMNVENVTGLESQIEEYKKHKDEGDS